MNEKNKIRVGICGYGNLGKGVEVALRENPDMELKVIFTRRDPKTIIAQTKNVEIVKEEEVSDWEEQLDVVILCGGSKEDIPKQLPKFAKYFNTVNTFDTHVDIPEMYDKIDKIAKEHNKVAVISAGWDPGIFSNIRKMGEAIFQNAKYYTFWGPGVSQGHSDAIRAIHGVKNAIQYSIPSQEIIDRIRNGETPDLAVTQMHIRDCYVAADEKDQERIEKEIKTMPVYFEGYNTIVHFVPEEEIQQRQKKIYHEGLVICAGRTNETNFNMIECHLKMDSNPEFTGAVAVSYARAAMRLEQRGAYGAKTVTEIRVDDMASEEQNKTFKYI